MVATQLQNQYGTKGFEIRNIRRMMQFAQKIPKEQIVSQLATQLTWSHIIETVSISFVTTQKRSDLVPKARGMRPETLPNCARGSGHF